MDIDALAADLARRLKLDFVPWEDEAPEKWAEARAMLADALHRVQEAARLERGDERVTTLSSVELDSVAEAIREGCWPGAAVKGWFWRFRVGKDREDWRRAARVAVAVTEAIRLGQRETVS